MGYNYNECKVLCKLKRKKNPITTKVKIDNMTDICQQCFDFEFDGNSKFYPYKLPKKLKHLKFKSLVITGASGSGKSTLLKEFKHCYQPQQKYDDNAIVSNFKNKKSAMDRLCSVGLGSIPTWCKPRKVLSVGEGFRADLALNLKSNTIFDEFTSTIDRIVAKSVCNGVSKFIEKHNLHNVVFCSCHKDFIDWLKPDFVIDLDEKLVYDCRDISLTPLHKKKKYIFMGSYGLTKVAEIIL